MDTYILKMNTIASDDKIIKQLPFVLKKAQELAIKKKILKTPADLITVSEDDEEERS